MGMKARVIAHLHSLSPFAGEGRGEGTFGAMTTRYLCFCDQARADAARNEQQREDGRSALDSGL